MPVPELDVWGSACSGRDGTGCGVGLGPGAAAPSETPILTVNGRVNGAPLSDDQSDPEINVAMRSIWASVRGVVPGEREADAASSGLMIADVGVGDPVGIGKNEELVPVELGIINRRAATLQFIAQGLERGA